MRRLKIYSVVLAVMLICHMSLNAQATSTATIHIRVINAKNGQPVKSQTVGVAIKGQKSQSQYVTDNDGSITLEVDPFAEIYVRTDWWITCHTFTPSEVPFVSIQTILADGFVDENTCGHAKSEPLRGKVIIFARKPNLGELLAR